ncbi:carbohydrate kinase family protein [Demequina salsinemoris]|uniref:carbohydrate kinase family protein n=1 Tax=Demequina salsinemoris TaxID=577470 RepID=UPI000782D529|nr:carbohydrate kinase family protein [Demequina salsinemoris]
MVAGAPRPGAPHVVVIGPTSIDTIVDLDELPEPAPHTVMARRWSTQLGGTSAGKALHLAEAGTDVLLVTTQGDDEQGRHATRMLTDRGVRVQAVLTDGPAERHLNLVAPPGRRLSIYLQPAGEPDPGGVAQARAVLDAELPGVDAVFLDLAPLALALEPVVTRTDRPVWVDVHDYDGADPFHAPFLAAADVILMNGDRIGDAEAFLDAAVRDGRHAAVCTLGPEGALGIAGDGTPVRVDAVPTRVIDTNGAGDAFAVGMLLRALEEGCADRPMTADELRRCMAAGAAQAARAISSPGLTPGLPAWGE